MKLYSTNNPQNQVSIRQAVLQSLPADKGLYMPESIPQLSSQFLNSLSQLTLQEIAYEIANQYLGDEIDEHTLMNLVAESINFPAPVITIDEKISILELFHGPTLAFKDFGARFMARLMNHFWADQNGKLQILVATSGDTGGAVASGFYGLEHIDVTILYPKGKVSKLQEAQLTTWGENIRAIEIEDDFDACQALVKHAFLDRDLNQQLNLSSANSINIARLIPQTFYYFEAVSQLRKDANVTFCVPSGNFGNLTAGLFAKKMGLPIHQMIAATNINAVVPEYLDTGIFNPGKAKPTLSNAMDIGNPSNFARIMNLYGSTWNHIKNDIVGYSFADDQTVEEIIKTHATLGYVLDPHTAVGVLAARKYLDHNPQGSDIVVLSTAHPIKFQSELEGKIPFKIPYPSFIHQYTDKPSSKITMDGSFDTFKEFLLR